MTFQKTKLIALNFCNQRMKTCLHINEDINHKFTPFPEGTLLVSWDVISMYPSINSEMGISACKRALDKRTTLSPSAECLLEATKINWIVTTPLQ